MGMKSLILTWHVRIFILVLAARLVALMENHALWMMQWQKSKNRY